MLKIGKNIPGMSYCASGNTSLVLTEAQSKINHRTKELDELSDMLLLASLAS